MTDSFSNEISNPVNTEKCPYIWPLKILMSHLRTYLTVCRLDSEPEGEEVRLGEELLWIDTNNEL